jgi:hypothetical protein
MRRYGVLLSLLLGLRPRARHLSASVRLGDLSGVAQINLALKTVSYYPQTEEWWDRLVGELLVRAPPVCLGPPCKVYESIDCRPLTIIWDYLPDWPWYPLWWNFVKIIILINCLYNLVAIVAYLVIITSTRTWAKMWKVRIHFSVDFWQINPQAKSLAY